MVRRQDGSYAGAISKDAGGWRVEDSTEYPIIFAELVDTADFIFMRGRFLQFFLYHPAGKIEVRIAPNFGQWLNCKVGLWVASIYGSDREYAGANSSASSICEAKIAGLRRASAGHFSEYEMELMAANEWPIKVIPALKPEVLMA